ncbi:MAG: hypothetical protein KA105_06295 [Caulobacter sp.]|nr:hypothetical protein [Caulobacter sp.]
MSVVPELVAFDDVPLLYTPAAEGAMPCPGGRMSDDQRSVSASAPTSARGFQPVVMPLFARGRGAR